jgi:CheY-like chemotaxis protein
MFRVRLFLPELQGVRAPQPLPIRAGYAGLRRRVLVVDNEEIDRTLLSSRLLAVGFDVLQAGSGHAALALLHEQALALTPIDAILMDLAMPGIDGWETIRTLRRQRLSTAPVAVVSANAFDKGLDNDVGITPADFITKPVRFDELLDWLGSRLGLQWLAQAPLPPPAPTPADAPRPTRTQLLALREVVNLGYPRGVRRLLDQIEAERPECTLWLMPLRELAAGFQFERITPLIDAELAPPRSAVGAPPQGGNPSGPAEPDSRRLLGGPGSC